MARPHKNKLPKEVQEAVKALEGATDQEDIKQLKKVMKKTASICGALKKNGTVCHRQPWINPDGSTNGRCASHSGKYSGQKTEEGRLRSLANLNPKARLIHGMYSETLKEQLTKEEAEFYNAMVDEFCEKYPESADLANLNLLHRFSINTIKTMRMESVDFMKESKSQNSFESMILRFAETLGLNKKFKDSKENKDNKSDISLAMLFDMPEEKE
ncbi:HGGxSTG domain-containing protein [Fredinandcohnia humi]